MSSMPMSRVWLITGSSRGFGRVLAQAVLDHGDRLVATARHLEHLSDLVTRFGERVRTATLDVTNPEQARAAVSAAVDAFGRLDVVVNNAAYRYYGPSRTPMRRSCAPRSRPICGG
jgi:NAD(P)-dependent dehydrogenase (short-subunit alcohol dehydrogenase family)